MENNGGFLAQMAAAASRWKPHISRASIFRLTQLARLDETMLIQHAGGNPDEVVEVDAGQILHMIRLARGTN